MKTTGKRMLFMAWIGKDTVFVGQSIGKEKKGVKGKS
jgi:hypothetical protein